MIEAAIGELERAGVTGQPEVALADAQYWNEQHMDEVIANKHIQVPDPTRLSRPLGAAAGLDRRAVLLDANRARIPRQASLSKTDPDDRAGVRSHQAQPHNHWVSPQRQTAVRTEWRLLIATHNLTKLHRHQLNAAGA